MVEKSVFIFFVVVIPHLPIPAVDIYRKHNRRFPKSANMLVHLWCEVWVFLRFHILFYKTNKDAQVLLFSVKVAIRSAHPVADKTISFYMHTHIISILQNLRTLLPIRYSAKYIGVVTDGKLTVFLQQLFIRRRHLACLRIVQTVAWSFTGIGSFYETDYLFVLYHYKLVWNMTIGSFPVFLLFCLSLGSKRTAPLPLPVFSESNHVEFLPFLYW